MPLSSMRPRPRFQPPAPYERPPLPGPIDLYLDGNEGQAPPEALLSTLNGSLAETLRRYPDAGDLERDLAARWGVSPEQVLVTAGADDALDRACRALLAPGREMILPSPTFEMLERYATYCGAHVRRVPWPGEQYPLGEVLAAITPRTALVAVVSPNNPTGAVATSDQLRELSVRAPGALLLVDAAYAEFADEDLTATALTLPNALVFRTFSKAWGLAGLRVGYVLGGVEPIGWLRPAGQPYAVSALSLALARAWLGRGETQVDGFRRRVRDERQRLTELLRGLGASVSPSQANFVFLRRPDAGRIRLALARRGIAVRGWPGHPDLGDALRITCPGDPNAFLRLCQALEAVLTEETRS